MHHLLKPLIERGHTERSEDHSFLKQYLLQLKSLVNCKIQQVDNKAMDLGLSPSSASLGKRGLSQRHYTRGEKGKAPGVPHRTHCWEEASNLVGGTLEDGLSELRPLELEAKNGCWAAEEG